jgi:hypothetical protein
VTDDTDDEDGDAVPGTLKSLLNKLRHGTASDTDWQDPQLLSSVLYDGPEFNLTEKVKVVRVEYINRLASVYPIPQVETALVIDVRSPIFDELRETDKGILTIDRLIKNRVRAAFSHSYYVLFLIEMYRTVIHGQAGLGRVTAERMSPFYLATLLSNADGLA